MDIVPSMLTKPADMLALEYWSINRKIPLWDNTSFNVVAQRIDWENLDAQRVVDKLMTIEAIYIKI